MRAIPCWKPIVTRSTGTDTTLAPTQNVAGIGADARRIIVARGLRSFAYGMLAVVLAATLSDAGFSAPAIGALVSVSLAGDLCGTYLIGLYADRWGRRRTLVVLALLLAATGVVVALVRVYPVLLIAAFCGTRGTSGSETAPFLPIERRSCRDWRPPPTAPSCSRAITSWRRSHSPSVRLPPAYPACCCAPASRSPPAPACSSHSMSPRASPSPR
jgi:hypothetical protein